MSVSRKNNDVKLKDLNKKISNVDKLDAAAVIVDSADLASIFGTFASAVGQAFLEEIGKFFMFPLAALANLARAALHWRKAWLDQKIDPKTGKLKMKTGNIVSSIVETLAAIAIT